LLDHGGTIPRPICKRIHPEDFRLTFRARISPGSRRIMHVLNGTAILLALFGLLMGLSVLASRAAGRVNVPVALLFLGIGVVAGSEGVGGFAFANYSLAFRLGTVTLVLILFDGGLSTTWSTVRRTVVPAGLLATVGVVLTAAVVALGARALGFDWISAFVLGGIVSSTDAAAVFSVLRGNRIELSKRLAATLELESGLNDPVAFILTVAFTGALTGEHVGGWRVFSDMVLELLLGAAVGLAVGWGGRWLLVRARPAAAGLLPVLTIALAFVAFGATTLVGGSGFLATYLAGIVLGNGPLPYRTGLLRVHDAMAWLGQVVMFLVLGLLSFPMRLLTVAPVGVALSLLLTFVARPLASLLCLLPFGYRAREIAFIGWVGLRGAVPIILAIFPVLANAPHAERIFDVVFFIVVTNALIPGATVRRAVGLLGVEVRGNPPPAAFLEIASTLPLRANVLSFFLEKQCAVAGARIADVPFPPHAAVMLIVRNEELVAPRGDSVLLAGDHVFVFCRHEDRATLDLLFGREED
jgi:cell volume regulation protein A